MRIYDESRLKGDLAANNGRPYQVCSKCVMDTIANNDILFDSKGICNYCHEYESLKITRIVPTEERKKKFDELVSQIKAKGKGKPYDCILGVSGGVDSSYLAYIAKQADLRPLIVHFDNGWNSELAVSNIEQLVRHLNFELVTYVMDWEEFRDLQKSYIKASVLDLEVPTDHLIFGALYKLADQYGIRYILSGWNYATESILPESWSYKKKFDAKNLLSIHSAYSKRKLTKLPILGFKKHLKYQLYRRIRSASLLNYIDYNKEVAKKFLIENLEWRNYGGKHHESIFTRFYQGYILPVKYNIDKRKAHLSSLICSGQMEREEALSELKQPTYDLGQQRSDFEYVAKKLGFSQAEFEGLLNQPGKSHDDFENEDNYWRMYGKMMEFISPAKPALKKIFRRND